MGENLRRVGERLIAVFAAVACALVLCASALPAYADEAVTDAEGLLAAVENAEAGVETTITLASDITLDETLEITGGKDITLVGGALTFDHDASYATHGNGATTVYVEGGSSLTLGEGFTLDGNADGSSHSYVALYSNGDVTLDGGTITNYYKGNSGNRSVILSEGSSASFTILSGSITGNQTGRNPGGILEVSMGASLVMSGGEISGNVAPTQSDCDAIVLVGISQYVNLSEGTNNDEGASFEFTGGTISGNTATSTVYVGEAYAALGPDYASWETTFTGLATMTMSGDATISDNTAGRFGGGVAVWGPGSFTMDGGTITGNSAGESGGGVAAIDMFVSGAMSANRAEREGVTIEEWSEYRPAAFTMNGGTISNNTAASTGGGVYVASNNVLLAAGTISGNSAGDESDPGQGGGIYVASTPYVLELDDALVTGNTASLLGGGVWICPSGSVASSISKGGAVIGNTAAADGAGDDVVSLTRDREGISTGSTLSLLNRMLGGYLVSWYEDGALMSPQDDGWILLGYPASDSVRYADQEESLRTKLEGSDLVTCDDDIALKAVAASGAIEAAESAAKLVVTDNTAARGGGIGSNGCVQFGDEPITEYPDTSVTVQKVWDDNDDAAGLRPESVTVSLYENGVKIDEQTLSDDNDWTYTWDALPLYVDYASEGDLNEYEVVEEAVEGYTSTTTASTDDETNALVATITNTYTPEPVAVDVTATKELTGATLEDGQFIFELLDETGSVVATATNDTDGLVDFGNLSFDAAGEYAFTVREVLPTDDDPNTEGVQQDGITYDEDTCTVTVTVMLNDEGALVATVDGEASFTNVYAESQGTVPGTDGEGTTPGSSEGDDTSASGTPATGSEGTLVQTSDSFNPVMVAVVLAAGCVLVAGGVYGHCKRS